MAVLLRRLTEAYHMVHATIFAEASSTEEDILFDDAVRILQTNVIYNTFNGTRLTPTAFAAKPQCPPRSGGPSSSNKSPKNPLKHPDQPPVLSIATSVKLLVVWLFFTLVIIEKMIAHPFEGTTRDSERCSG